MTNNFVHKVIRIYYFQIRKKERERTQPNMLNKTRSWRDSVTYGFDILDNFDIYIKMGLLKILFVKV